MLHAIYDHVHDNEDNEVTVPLTPSFYIVNCSSRCSTLRDREISRTTIEWSIQKTESPWPTDFQASLPLRYLKWDQWLCQTVFSSKTWAGEEFGG